MLNKFVSLAATGAPGATRVLFALLCNILFSSVGVVGVLSDFALVIALSMLLSQGFSILLLKESPTDEENSITFSSYISAFIATLLIYMLYTINVFSILLPNILFFIGLIGYQNIRSRLLRKQQFWKACFLEIAILVTILVICCYLYVVGILTVGNYYLCFSSVFFCLSILNFLSVLFQKKTVLIIKAALVQASFIGATNLLSSGVIWIMPKLSTSLFTTEQVFIITNLSFLLGLIGLLPRTFVNRNLSKINSAVKHKENATIQHLNVGLRHLLLKLLIPVVCVCYVYYTFALNFNPESISLFLLLITLVCISTLEAQKNLINSTLLTFLNMNQYTLLFNVFYTTILGVSLVIIGLLKQHSAVSEVLIFIFYGAMLSAIYLRNYLLSNKVRALLESLRKS
jgi:hypothetical protein